MKKKYLTKRNISKKILTWKKALAPFSKYWGNFKLANSALLVIDVQNYFLDPKSHAFVPSASAVLPQINSAIDLFQKSKRPIFYTRFAVKKNEKDPIGTWWGATVRESSSESELFHKLTPLPDERVIRKTHYNAFLGTKLLKQLRQDKVSSILICGVLTHLCCESTARAAFEEGLEVFMLADGTASSTEALHIHSLQSLSSGFATPIFTDDL